MLVDTGAERSLVTEAAYRKHQDIWGPLHQVRGSVNGATGEPLHMLGETGAVRVIMGEVRLDTKLLVMGGKRNEGIVGMDVLLAVGAIIDLGRQKIYTQASETQVREGVASPIRAPLATSDPASLAAASVSASRLPMTTPPESSPLQVAETIWLPACSYGMVPLRTETLTACAQLFVPTREHFPLQISPAVLDQSVRRVLVSNPSDQDVCLPEGAVIGEVAELGAGEVQETLPWEEDRQEPPGEPCLPAVSPQLTAAQQHELYLLLREYLDVFAQGSGDLGRAEVVEHQIHTHGPPLRQPLRRQPPGYRLEEQRQVKEMQAQGVVRPSQSPWASPEVLVKKKDGSLRFCVDYRKLNEVTIKDAQPLPRIDDALDALQGSMFFSTLDLQKGYFQVPLRPQDREKTAFATSFGELWEFNVLPMGVCNGPATFSRLMERVLQGLQWKQCIAYLDDIIVFAPTFPEHLKRLRAVFQRLREAKLKLKPGKCTLARPQVAFLGHVVSREGLQADPAKVQAIEGVPTPRTVREVRSFLGLASYYRRFVPGFATVARPLHRLLEKPHGWEWSGECQAAFQALKQALMQPPIMAYPDYNLPFRVAADASNFGLGAVLSQLHGDRERVVMYASRSLTTGERNYSATKKRTACHRLGSA